MSDYKLNTRCVQGGYTPGNGEPRQIPIIQSTTFKYDTQEVFAETLDVGVEHYRKIESGVYGLQPEKMLILYEKYRIEPTYLVTGDTNHKVDIELFLANCSREERDAFIDRMLAYMRKLMTGR